jgi:hypothetical protein
MCIYAFSGSHGTGKTVSAYQFVGYLARRNPGRTVGVVTDVERTCPFPINREATERTQEWIFCHQLAAEEQALSNYDIVISDRTVMDVIAYTYVAGYRTLAHDMRKYSRHRMNLYTRIMFLLIKSRGWNLPEGFRDTDHKFRQQVEDILMTLYWMEGIKKQGRYTEI